MNEIHPYNESEPIPEGTCLLIIGTAPPPRFSAPRSKDWNLPGQGDVDFYYGSTYNQLWSMILPELYEHRSLENSRAMRQFLSDHKMWMRDVLQVYRRKEGKSESAKDMDIIPLAYTDFRPTFAKHTTIDTVVFTGDRAEKWTGKQLEAQGVIEPGQLSCSTKGQVIPRKKRFTISLEGKQRDIDFHTLPSPSAGNWRLYSDDQKKQYYKDVVLNRCPKI